MFSFPYYARNYNQDFFLFQESLKKKSSLNQSTISNFARVWFRNYFVNLNLSIHREQTGFIFGNSFPFQNKDVLFVGAAPILEEQISWIRSNQDRLFILSSDTACYTLIANQIRPDFIVSIDASRGTIFHFREIPSDIPIITWLGANSHLFRLPNPIYLYLSTYPLDQVLHSTLFSEEENILKNPSLNVAGITKSIAEKFFASRFIMSGISFKMQSGKTHCRGTGYENYHLPRVNRYYPMEAYSPITYQKEISSKNQLALHHLTERNKLTVIKPEDIYEVELGTAVYKTKPLSLKVSKEKIQKFQKLLKNQTLQREILQESGIDKKFYDRFLSLIS